MGFEESVELVPVSKTEQPPQFGLSDVTALEFLECQGFEGAAREIGTGRAHAAGEIVGNLDGKFHALSPYPILRIRSIKACPLAEKHPVLGHKSFGRKGDGRKGDAFFCGNRGPRSSLSARLNPGSGAVTTLGEER